MLSMIARFGMNGADYQAVEFTGDAVRALSMQERMTLCNMSAELGAQTGLVAPDDVTWQWLRETGVAPLPGDGDAMDWASDPSSFDVQHDFDAAALSPQLAAPHSPAASSARFSAALKVRKNRMIGRKSSSSFINRSG